MRASLATLLVLAAVAATNESFAQGAGGTPRANGGPWGYGAYGMPSQPAPKPLPPPTVGDFGVSQSVVVRGGLSSGLRLGGGLALSYRSTTWPYDSTWGIDALQVDLFTELDHAGIGWRVSPFNFIFSLWSDSVFQNGYIRWNLVEFGGTTRADHTSSLEVGGALSFGYSIELSEGVALRLFEVGSFGGVFVRSRDGDAKAVGDVGFSFTTGVTIR